jgi:hypothetical protein
MEAARLQNKPVGLNAQCLSFLSFRGQAPVESLDAARAAWQAKLPVLGLKRRKKTGIAI